VFLKEQVHVKRYSASERYGPSYVDYAENDFVQDCLFWHNHFRRKHRAPFLLLSLRLCEQAQRLANFIAHTNDLYHRKLRDIGQNLYVESSYTQDNFDVNGETVVKHWYSEQKHYDYYQNRDLLHTQASRFTQLVWKSSQKVGIGKATIGAGKVIVVALYKPAGNVAGEFHNNVFSVPIRRTTSLGSASTSAAQSDDESASGSATSSLNNNQIANAEAVF
ncbi:golgi-associated plant pathogenesis-related protein 1-like, partial [Tropilaelaps mercedesae]